LPKVSFFIDGFNVYHSLRNKQDYYKYLWLDYRRFLQRFVRKRDTLSDIFYFSAYANWDKIRVKKHRMLIDIWKSTGIETIMGDFKEKDRFCKNCRTYFKSHEEKQTDVNIGIYLIKEFMKIVMILQFWLQMILTWSLQLECSRTHSLKKE